MIYLLTGLTTGTVYEIGTKEIIVLNFVKKHDKPIAYYRCMIYDDIGLIIGEVDLAATKLKGKIVRK